jgi:protein TilB
MTTHSKESRRKMYQEMAEEKLKKEKDRNPEKFAEKKESPMFNKEGEIRQCNEGRYRYSLQEFKDPEWTTF